MRDTLWNSPSEVRELSALLVLAFHTFSHVLEARVDGTRSGTTRKSDAAAQGVVVTQ